MHLEDIRKVLQRCYVRQAESGAKSAFRLALIIGPKRKAIFANYPDTQNTGPTESDSNRHKKNKGKQRQDPLEGLLPFEGSAFDIETEVAGTSTNHRESRSSPPKTAPHEDHLVRINMGQMLQLREMGYEVLGPVNGPNEGFPEYEVPKAMVDILTNRQLHRSPSLTHTSMGPVIDTNAIDPALLAEPEPNEAETIVPSRVPPKAGRQDRQPNIAVNIPPITVPQPSITTTSTIPPSEDSGQDCQPSHPSIIPQSLPPSHPAALYTRLLCRVGYIHRQVGQIVSQAYR